MGTHWKILSKGVTGSNLCFKWSAVGRGEPRLEEDLGGLACSLHIEPMAYGPSSRQDPIVCLWLWSESHDAWS